MIRSDDVVSRASDVLFSQLDGELLAVDTSASYLYSLNDSAARVWELIEQPVRVGDVCARLSREFAVDDATCATAVLALLQGLRDAGLVFVHADLRS
jgi:phosphosulfolactate phosphohydrolase-like enzyme